MTTGDRPINVILPPLVSNFKEGGVSEPKPLALGVALPVIPVKERKNDVLAVAVLNRENGGSGLEDAVISTQVCAAEAEDHSIMPVVPLVHTPADERMDVGGNNPHFSATLLTLVAPCILITATFWAVVAWRGVSLERRYDPAHCALLALSVSAVLPIVLLSWTFARALSMRQVAMVAAVLAVYTALRIPRLIVRMYDGGSTSDGFLFLSVIIVEFMVLMVVVPALCRTAPLLSPLGGDPPPSRPAGVYVASVAMYAISAAAAVVVVAWSHEVGMAAYSLALFPAAMVLLPAGLYYDVRTHVEFGNLGLTVNSILYVVTVPFPLINIALAYLALAGPSLVFMAGGMLLFRAVGGVLMLVAFKVYRRVYSRSSLAIVLFPLSLTTELIVDMAFASTIPLSPTFFVIGTLSAVIWCLRDGHVLGAAVGRVEDAFSRTVDAERPLRRALDSSLISTVQLASDLCAVCAVGTMALCDAWAGTRTIARDRPVTEAQMWLRFGGVVVTLFGRLLCHVLSKHIFAAMTGLSFDCEQKRPTPVQFLFCSSCILYIVPNLFSGYLR